MTIAGRVSPFGYLRIKARLLAPRSFSQAATSFFACNRQGIHHMHLFTWLHYFNDLSSKQQPQTTICSVLFNTNFIPVFTPSLHSCFNQYFCSMNILFVCLSMQSTHCHTLRVGYLYLRIYTLSRYMWIFTFLPQPVYFRNPEWSALIKIIIKLN